MSYSIFRERKYEEGGPERRSRLEEGFSNG